jgi:hypothetical protein
VWVYLPTTCCPSAPDLEPSTSELASHAQALAASVWSRGEPTKPSFWLRAWKRGTYRRLRSGATRPPSSLSDGVASWIASLLVTPASPTAWPAPSAARTTTAGSSTTLSGSLKACGLVVSSERTCRGTPTVSSSTSSRHWKDWVGALRLECSRREPPALRRNDSGSSSWPTLAARDYRSPNSQASQASQARRNEKSSRGQQLANFVAWELPKLWATLTAAAAYGGQLTRGNERSDELLISGQAICLSLLLGLTTSTDGESFSATLLSLNPPFGELLMGWPIGWTALRPLETELSQWWSRAHGLAWRLACEQPQSAQRSLFGDAA